MPQVGSGKTGVYCWLNLVNGMRYVGSTAQSFKARQGSYLRGFKKDLCHNLYLLRAWKKYGEDSFEFQILERCPPDTCIEREQYWINFYGSCNSGKGYNLCPLAGSALGYKHRPESIEKFASKLRGKPKSKEHRQNLSDARSGVAWSAKQRKAIMASRRANRRCMSRNSRGEANNRALLSEAQVVILLQWPNGFDGQLIELARKMGVRMGVVQAIRSGRNWSHLYKFHSKFRTCLRFINR